jgi:uncharacterized protein YciI
MFIILATYKKPIEIVEQHLAEHISFLDRGYENNYFIVSGRKNPRTGGVIISQLKDRAQLEKIIAEDPFYRLEIADYEIIEMIPTKFHREFSCFL